MAGLSNVCAFGAVLFDFLEGKGGILWLLGLGFNEGNPIKARRFAN